MRHAESPTAATMAQPVQEFSVQWERPEESQWTWTIDRMHFPEPLTPFDFQLFGECFSKGFGAAVRSYQAPLEGAPCKHVNTYRYWAIVQAGAPPEEMARMGKAAEQNIGAAMGRLGELWDKEWLPEMKAHLSFWDTFDLRHASTGDLLRHLEETIERSTRVLEIHFRLIIPMYIAISQFDELHKEVFGGGGAFDAYKLLQGFDNKTLESGRALWRLSRVAKASPEVARVLEHSPSSEVVAALRRTAAGQAFVKELETFLQAYGRRGEGLSVDSPGWTEDPTPVFKNLKDYLSQPDKDPEATLKGLAAERERLVAQARDRLTGYPAAVREGFEFLLKAAQTANALSEEHTFWIEFGFPYRVRQVLLEFGRRFTEAGLLAQPTDVTLLTMPELRETALSTPALDRRRLAAARTAEMERYRAVTPPELLGAPPSAGAPADAMSVALGKLFGAPTGPSASPDILNGHPGSPGTVRGRVKVVRSLREAEKVQRGDVLVAETTSPPWTPLFATVAAVVTDTGGVLSHCAIVAREYRIPAVVGAGNATRVLKDGQMVEVRGSEGVVKIVA